MEKEDDGETPRIGALKFLSVIQKKVSYHKDAIGMGLCFLMQSSTPDLLKGIMVESDATHNFIIKQETCCQTSYKWPLELVELRKKLDELLSVGFIRPIKTPYRAPVLFQKKKVNGSNLNAAYERRCHCN